MAGALTRAFADVARLSGLEPYATGHSLGGAEAQVGAAAAGIRVVTFDSPGVRNEIDALAARNGWMNSQQTADSVENFYRPFSIVSQSALTSDQVGRQIEVPLSSDESSKLSATGGLALGGAYTGNLLVGGLGVAGYLYFNFMEVHSLDKFDVQGFGEPQFGGGTVYQSDPIHNQAFAQASCFAAWTTNPDSLGAEYQALLDMAFGAGNYAVDGESFSVGKEQEGVQETIKLVPGGVWEYYLNNTGADLDGIDAISANSFGISEYTYNDGTGKLIFNGNDIATFEIGTDSTTYSFLDRPDDAVVLLEDGWIVEGGENPRAYAWDGELLYSEDLAWNPSTDWLSEYMDYHNSVTNLVEEWWDTGSTDGTDTNWYEPYFPDTDTTSDYDPGWTDYSYDTYTYDYSWDYSYDDYWTDTWSDPWDYSWSYYDYSYDAYWDSYNQWQYEYDAYWDYVQISDYYSDWGGNYTWSDFTYDYDYYSYDSYYSSYSYSNNSYYTYGYFFDGETPVLMADGGTRPIAEVRVGDEVASFDGLGELVAARVLNTIAMEDQELVELSAEGAGAVRCTPLHRFLTADGTYKPVLRLSDSDRLVAADGTVVGSAKVSGGFSRALVYNLTVENLHTYVAGGFRVHNMKPVVVDLDGDNQIELIGLDEAGVLFDLDEDGFAEAMAWVSPEDGLLAYDMGGDGKITGAREIAFSLWSARQGATDLEGLAEAFDSNHDGVLNAADAEWSKFGVWQDADHDGVTDAGEFKGLAELGITSITVTSNGQQSTSQGNTVFGTASFTKADGSTGIVGDVDLDAEEKGWAEIQRQGNTAILAGEGGLTGAKVVEGASSRLLNVTAKGATVGFGSSGGDVRWAA